MNMAVEEFGHQRLLAMLLQNRRREDDILRGNIILPRTVLRFRIFDRMLGETLMNGYITVQEAAEKWKITPRQVQILCKEGHIEGAEMMSQIWVIPEDAETPTRKPKDK